MQMPVVNILKTDKYSELYTVKCNVCIGILKVSWLSLAFSSYALKAWPCRIMCI